ncbi:DUF1489 domain-containing protein [Limibaculum sp. M0105]|uniref:DUF1489 domain-containing protein n=1 Tax=Thermohalobaculum xanthum TaxID=2753746 RepID=A0A8J7SEC2_9RHOB|nr:DUF1489 domain-containing protein [Thermohalobaculum xanthum]MBK0400577.1 DUF1489 domain-containing protein [Thermohalobaculum xanthum]
MPSETGKDALHLVKLCVGADSIEDLAEWQAARSAERRAAGLDPRPRHVTRMWPRRQDDLLAGGSLYWVIRGLVLVRQRILSLDPVTGEDGIRRCALILDPELVRVEARPRSAFQGWRYLRAGDAPPDLPKDAQEGAGLPQEMQSALAALGVIG